MGRPNRRPYFITAHTKYQPAALTINDANISYAPLRMTTCRNVVILSEAKDLYETMCINASFSRFDDLNLEL